MTALTRLASTDATTSRTALYKLRNGILGAGSYTLATSSTAYTDTYTGSASANWSMIAVAFKAATTTLSPTVSYVHADQLGSTAIVTNASGTPAQTLDYYPYGAARVNSGTPIESRQYIGQFADSPTSLSYLNARYYDPARGQFTSEDPVFWEIGLTKDGKHALENPQSLNSYAYGNDNPIVGKDPTGRSTLEGSASMGTWYAGATVGADISTDPWAVQFYLGPTLGPSIGGQIQAAWDPAGSLDPSGFYTEPSASAAFGIVLGA
ncbi:MAG: RHS repeat-associated core domain-containing protein [Hyphomicrobium sp.]|nr:RHS repeat-associated core domain-containing protein [Hyphomicrobium sp.]